MWCAALLMVPESNKAECCVRGFMEFHVSGMVAVVLLALLSLGYMWQHEAGGWKELRRHLPLNREGSSRNASVILKQDNSSWS